MRLTFTTYSADATVGRLTPGRDGAVWFLESGVNKIGRITTAGVITGYVTPHPLTTGQVEVVRGDLTLPATLNACLGGVDAVFPGWRPSARPPLPRWSGLRTTLGASSSSRI